MATLYKLTDANWETRGPTKWGPGVTHGPLSGKGNLCGPGWLHAYTSPELAILLNPIHASIKNPVLWEAEGEIEKTDMGLKVGVRTLTTIRILEAPKVTTEHRVRFGLLCALKVYDDPAYVRWANAWLSGEDRTVKSADAAAAGAAAYAAAYAAYAAADAAARAAARAAAYAADAAYAAAYAADAARAAADAAYAAADAAANAAYAANAAGGKLDLVVIAKKALED